MSAAVQRQVTRSAVALAAWVVSSWALAAETTDLGPTLGGFATSTAPVATPGTAPVTAPGAAPADTPGRAPGGPGRPAGDARRGAALAASRTAGLCVLCHPVPGVAGAHQGNLGPDLAGAGSRWSAEALRERLLHPERANPDTLMPAYGRTEGLHRVAPARRGQPLLDAQQIEDVLAWLGSLQ